MAATESVAGCSDGDSNDNHLPTQNELISSQGNSSNYGSELNLEDVLQATQEEPVILPKALSDYGSDFDTDGEEAIQELLTKVEDFGGKPLVLESLEEDVTSGCLAYVPLFSSQGSRRTTGRLYLSALEEQETRPAQAKIEYDTGGEAQLQVPSPFPQDTGAEGARKNAAPEHQPPSTEGKAPDTRSPLERFRSPPKKPLSVTDIISPAWCELQYWFSLTKHGRKKRTPAMKQGTRVHQELESQVHEVVPIEVKTREDGWGLRIWNVIQGLRTLRATGLTREFEIWGVIDGQVVNGIIDELSFACPDQDLEEAITESRLSSSAPPVPENQITITDFYASHNAHANPWVGNPHALEPARKVFITDIKTRTAKSLPSKASMRPTLMQLMLYRRLLTALATGLVPRDTVLARYKLSPDAAFSDTFISGIAALDYNFGASASTSDDRALFSGTAASVSELRQHNSLARLWDLMLAQFAITIPTPDAVGSVLTVEFRSQADGAVLGTRTFANDDEELARYVQDEMRWWKGQRLPRGVDVEEAFKCRICEFAEGCEWRIAKVDDAVARARQKRSGDGRAERA